MLFSMSFSHKRYIKKRQCWVREHWRVHLLFFVIPLWINNWKTEYIHANGKPLENYE